MTLLQDENETILWNEPLISVTLISEFIQRLPHKHKQNIWNRYANSDGYLKTYNIIQALHSFLTLLIKIKDKSCKPPKRNQIESKLQPLCNVISQKVEDMANGVSQYEFNNNLHEWILLPPTSSPKSFISLLTPSSDENVSSNIQLPSKTILIQSHSLNLNSPVDCAITPIGFDEECDEKMAITLSPPMQSTVLQQSSQSVDYINAKKNKKKKKKNKKKIPKLKKSKTNNFLFTIKVGQTVKLTKDRIAYVRFKGKVKFSIGIWYGVEIYDALTNTRHNGNVFGKKYFNCPRNKGMHMQNVCSINPTQ